MAEYIDREAFKKSVEERYCKPCKAEGKDHNGCWCRACWVDDMLDEVECFHPSDAAPVVHGRWICIRKGYEEYECSVCHGMDSNCSDYYADHVVTEQEYCPNCGAKMDGGAD